MAARCSPAAYMNTIVLLLRSAGGGFVPLGSYSVAAHHAIESAMTSGDAARAVAGSIHYDQHTTAGAVISLLITPTGFSAATTTEFDSGVMRVAITQDDAAWGGALHDANCVCFLAGSTSLPARRHRSDVPAVIAYAFGITGSASGTVYVAYGVNL
jgi:hypothetical protein